MPRTVIIPSAQRLQGQLEDAWSTASAVLAAYQERLERYPEGELLIRQCGHLTHLREELKLQAGNIPGLFENGPTGPGVPEKTYHGTRDNLGCSVRVIQSWGRGDSFDCPLPERQDLISHSPGGLAWGYPGSGPAQLAMALLADLTGNGEYAVRRHQELKRDVIARILHDRWTIHGEDLAGWVRDHP
jgi:hypothetical protein